jgi:SAM-dependent methyltransferase
MIQTVEHVDQPDSVLQAVRSLLKPGGRLMIVTDNTDSVDFGLFKSRYWGGYHFPRHWNLFNCGSLTKLAKKVGFEVDEITTQVTPVNWVYSIHNALADKGAPQLLIDQFSLKSTISLSVFTSLDMVLQKLGRGGLLRAVLRKPRTEEGL